MVNVYYTDIKISLSNKGDSLCLNCANSMVYANHSLLSFWEIGTLIYAGQRCLCDQPPIRTLGAESLMGFPGQKHCIHVSAFSLLEEGGVSSPHEREHV